MKVAFLTRYDERRASSRVRAYQYRPHLAALGVESRILPWAYPPRTRWPVYAARALALARWADVVVLQKPFQPTWLVDALARANDRLVVDVDDALWEPPEETSARDRAGAEAIGVRFDHAVRRAGTVVAGSAHLASLVAGRVPGVALEVIPSPVEPTAFPARSHADRTPVVAGWVGSPENLADFAGCADALRDVAGEGRIVVRVVSSRPLELPGVDAEFVPWTAAGEPEAVAGFDIGLMPLRDTARTRGRCGFKAIEYLAAGVPAIASDVPGPREVVDHDVTGLVVDGTDAWREALRRLAGDVGLRRRLGGAGRAVVAERFATEVNAARLVDVLAGRVGGAPAPLGRPT